MYLGVGYAGSRQTDKDSRGEEGWKTAHTQEWREKLDVFKKHSDVKRLPGTMV